MRMPTITFDLGKILIDRILAVITAIVRFRFCGAYAHIVLTFFACHRYLPNLACGSLDLDIDVLFLRAAHKTAAVEKHTGDDRHDDY